MEGLPICDFELTIHDFRPEDVLKLDADEDGIRGDDAADACRYLIASKPRAVAQRKLRGFNWAG